MDEDDYRLSEDALTLADLREREQVEMGESDGTSHNEGF